MPTTAHESSALRKAREKRERAMESLKDAISNLEVVTDAGVSRVHNDENVSPSGGTAPKLMTQSSLDAVESEEVETLRRARGLLQKSSTNDDGGLSGHSRETEIVEWPDKLGSGDVSINDNDDLETSGLAELDYPIAESPLKEFNLQACSPQSKGSGQHMNSLNGSRHGSRHNSPLKMAVERLETQEYGQESTFEMQAERDRALKLCLQYRQKMGDLKAKIKTKDDKIADLEDRVAKAEDSISKSKELFSEMMTKVKEGVDNQVQLENEAKKSKEEVVQLAAGLRKMRTLVERLEQELSERRQENRVLQDMIEQHERAGTEKNDKSTAELTMKLSNCERQLAETQLDLHRSTESNHAQRADLNEAQQAHEKALCQVEELEEALNKAEQRLMEREQLNVDITNSQNDVTVLQEMVEKLEDELEAAQKDATQRESEWADEIEALKQDRQSSEMQVEKLTDELEKAKSETQMSEWAEEVEILREEKGQLETQIEELTAALEQKVLAEQHEVHELTFKKGSGPLQQRSREASEEQEGNNDQSAKLAEEVEVLCAEKEKIQSEKENLEADKNAVEAEVAELRSMLEKMQSELKNETAAALETPENPEASEEMSQQLSELEKQLAESQDKCGDLQQQVEALQSQCSEKDLSIRKLAEQLKKLQEEKLDAQLQRKVQHHKEQNKAEDTTREDFLEKISADSDQEYFTFLKHGNRGKPKQRVLRCNTNKTHIFYHDPGNTNVKPKALIPLEGLQMIIGRSPQLFKTQAPSSSCISLVNGKDGHTGRQVLNMQCSSEALKDELVSALSGSMEIYRSQSQMRASRGSSKNSSFSDQESKKSADSFQHPRNSSLPRGDSRISS